MFSTAFSFESYAQTNLALGVYYNPSFTGKVTRSDSALSWLKGEWNKLESGSVGYSVGAYAERSFSSRLSVRAGAGFSSFGERTDSLNDLGIDNYRTDYRFIEVPVVATFYLGENKYRRPYFSAGYAMNYFLNKRVTYSLIGSTRNESAILKGEEKILSNALRISFGYDFLLEKKWNLRTELYATQFITALTQVGVKRYPNALGLSFQIRKK